MSTFLFILRGKRNGPRIFYAGCPALFRGNESRKRLKRGPQKNLRWGNWGSVCKSHPLSLCCLDCADCPAPSHDRMLPGIQHEHSAPLNSDSSSNSNVSRFAVVG